MKKKILTVLLLGVMSASLLTGCGRSVSAPMKNAIADDGLIYVREITPEYREGPQRSYKSRTKWLESALEKKDTQAEKSESEGQSLEEWVNDDMLQSIISSMSSSEMKIYVEAVDDRTIAFRFQYKDQIPIENSRDRTTFKELFDSAIDSQKSVFIDMRDSIAEETGIKNLVMRIEYLNADGSVIYSRDFTK